MAKVHRNSLQPGYRVHWYEIIEILGQGGFGITYLAFDTNLKQKVAIKEYLPIELAVREGDQSVHPISADLTDGFSWGLEKFIAEAQTLARFKHPNIVQVFAVFEENNTAYMVMQYEDGECLQDILTRQKMLEESEILNILLPLLGGLELIHAAGFIHRDIKPANIFIRKDGSPVLLDFGSARQALATKTKAITSLVSPGYAPFEQYGGMNSAQGPWTDIYGLGATLYRCISGRSPQDSIDRSEAIIRTGTDVFVPASEVGEGRFSERLLFAIDKALEFRFELRPQTIKEWKSLLENIRHENHSSEAVDDEAITAVSPNQPTGYQSKFARFLADRLVSKRSLPAFAVLASVVILIFAISATKLEKNPLSIKLEVTNAKIGRQHSINEIDLASLQVEANNGIDSAQNTLGLLYAAGDVVDKDDEQAAYWLQKSADQGNAEAQVNLGRLYELGVGVPQSLVQAEAHYRSAAEQGYPVAFYTLGDLYARLFSIGATTQEKMEEGIKLLESAAAAGVAEANGKLGAIYQTGNGVPTDERRAHSWFLQGAKEGDSLSQVAVGMAFFFGYGVAINKKEGLNWFELAAEKGNAMGQTELARAYMTGSGTEVNYGASLKWLRKAAAQDWPEAHFLLANHYVNGYGVPKDETMAAGALVAAAKLGHASAQMQLAVMLANGQGLPQNDTEAFNWTKQAAEQGLPIAQFALGQIYLDGTGVSQSDTDALLWFRKAAEQGERAAQTSLGLMYQSGRGVAPDDEEAEKWFRMAAGQGDYEAQVQIEKIKNAKVEAATAN